MRLSLLIPALLVASSAMATQPLEGEWQVNDDGPLLSIVASPGSPDRLSIVWIDGPDLGIAEGTEVGMATPSVTPGLYDCTAWKDPRGDKGRKKGKVHFAIRLDSASADSFVFEGYEKKKVFRLNALLPYWTRRTFIKNIDTRPERLDGARRSGALPQYVEL